LKGKRCFIFDCLLILLFTNLSYGSVLVYRDPTGQNVTNDPGGIDYVDVNNNNVTINRPLSPGTQ